MSPPSAHERSAAALERIEQLLAMSIEERRREAAARDRERYRVGGLRESIAETREERWLLFLRAMPQMMQAMHRMPEERFTLGADGARVECRCGLTPTVETDHQCECSRLYVLLGGRLFVVVTAEAVPRWERIARS